MSRLLRARAKILIIPLEQSYNFRSRSAIRRLLWQCTPLVCSPTPVESRGDLPSFRPVLCEFVFVRPPLETCPGIPHKVHENDRIKIDRTTRIRQSFVFFYNRRTSMEIVWITIVSESFFFFFRRRRVLKCISNRRPGILYPIGSGLIPYEDRNDDVHKTPAIDRGFVYFVHDIRRFFFFLSRKTRISPSGRQNVYVHACAFRRNTNLRQFLRHLMMFAELLRRSVHTGIISNPPRCRCSGRACKRFYRLRNKI